MNQFLQNNIISIVVSFLLLIFILISVFIFIFIKILRQKKTSDSLEVTPSREDQDKKIKELILEKNFCLIHTEVLASGSCLICEDVFCEKCLVDHENMHFCKDHFRLFSNFKWKQITDEKTTPDTPLDGLYIYNFKRTLWIKKNIPTFVMTHYKINIENDYIESFVQLNVRESDAEKLTLDILKYKSSPFEDEL